MTVALLVGVDTPPLFLVLPVRAIVFCRDQAEDESNSRECETVDDDSEDKCCEHWGDRTTRQIANLTGDDAPNLHVSPLISLERHLCALHCSFPRTGATMQHQIIFLLTLTFVFMGFFCNTCSTSYPTRSSLASHYNRYHRHPIPDKAHVEEHFHPDLNGMHSLPSLSNQKLTLLQPSSLTPKAINAVPTISLTTLLLDPSIGAPSSLAQTSNSSSIHTRASSPQNHPSITFSTSLLLSVCSTEKQIRRAAFSAAMMSYWRPSTLSSLVRLRGPVSWCVTQARLTTTLHRGNDRSMSFTHGTSAKPTTQCLVIVTLLESSTRDRTSDGSKASVPTQI